MKNVTICDEWVALNGTKDFLTADKFEYFVNFRFTVLFVILKVE